MLKHAAFYSGHREPVLALIQNEEYFYSAGADGLIVKWDLKTPNEGQVLTRLSGYVSGFKYDVDSNQLVVAVNYKGIFFLDINVGQTTAMYEVSNMSFNQLEITAKYLFLVTTLGEILCIRKKDNELILRIETGLSSSTVCAVNGSEVWYSNQKEIISFNIEDIKEKIILKTTNLPCWMKYVKGEVVIWDGSALIRINYKKSKLEYVFKNTEKDIKKLWISDNGFSLITELKNNQIVAYEWLKNNYIQKNIVQNEHNGQINHLLWIENYKFVITAGEDKKIGIWQVT